MDTIATIIDTIWIYNSDTVYSTTIVKDSLIIYDMPQELLNNYLEILKSTNEQLGLWHNPYGILITALGVLFTLLAIVATILFWMQGRSFKVLVDKTVKKYEGILSTFVKKKEEELKSIDLDIDEKITEFKEKLKKANDEQKKEIEKNITELKERKELIKQELNDPYVSPIYFGGSTGPGSYSTLSYHKCSQCGYGFLINKPLPGFGTVATIRLDPTIHSYSASSGVQCPKCGNVDQV